MQGKATNPRCSILFSTHERGNFPSEIKTLFAYPD